MRGYAEVASLSARNDNPQFRAPHADHDRGLGASTGPPALRQAPKPPSMCATFSSPISCAVFAASADRQPPAQKNTNRLSSANTGLWYGLSGSIQNSSIPRVHANAPGMRP